MSRISHAGEVQAFCLAAGLTEGLLALGPASGPSDAVLLPLSIAFACAAGWIAWTASLFRLRVARGLLLLGGSGLLWLARLSWSPADHRFPAAAWFGITAALLVLPAALAFLPSPLFVASAPLLAAAAHAALSAGSLHGPKGLAALAVPGLVAAALAVLSLFAVRRAAGWRTASLFAGAAAGAASLLFPLLAHRTATRVTSASSPARAAPAPPGGEPNVVLVVLDSLRRDRLGAYGYGSRPVSPVLDAFARDAEVYTNAFASSSWTLPSVATMFSGEAPEIHGVTVAGRSFAAERPLLAETFAARGYDTLGVTTNQLTDSGHGFARGFRRYLELSRVARAARRTPTLAFEALDAFQRLQREGALPRLLPDWNTKPRARAAVTAALDELDGRAPGRPVFLYLHLLDPHEPYDAPRSPSDSAWALAESDRAFDARASLAYDREIRSLDRELGRFLVQLEGRLDLRNTLVAIVADHGEHLGEDKLRGHGQDLTEALLAVPLFVRWPDRRAGAREAPFPLASLRALLQDRTVAGTGWPVGASLVPPFATGESWRAARSAGWKLVEVDGPGTSRRALYQLPDEHTDESAARADIAEALAAALPPRASAATALDREDAARLRALGYVR